MFEQIAAGQVAIAAAILLAAYFAALPLVLGALYLGGRVHVGLSQAQMTRLVGLLLLVSSVSLLFKALHT